MPSITSLLSNLRKDYPRFTFTKASDFRWSPTEMVVSYEPSHPQASALLLHELSHGLLAHSDYSRDIELLAMERDAWEHAQTLASRYEVLITEDGLQDHLDTYRDWLHARSTCPHCQAVGHQIKKQVYHCVACNSDWRVNEARLCGLKRYKLAQNNTP